MLSPVEFDEWYHRVGLSKMARREIEYIRSSPPARLVRSRIGNAPGLFNQSRKMDHTIQHESRTVELIAILMMEYDDDILEIWDQPPSFKINFRGTNGRNLGHTYTADFFVLRKNSAGWEEWKPEETLAKLAAKNPNRYYLGAEGKWQSPPCEEYASRFGLYFRVRSSAEINWVLQRNYKFLQPYFLIESDLLITEEVKQAVMSVVSSEPGITIAQLVERIGGITNGDIYKLIAIGLIYADLRAAWLGEPERFHVYSDKTTCTFFERLSETQPQTKDHLPCVADLVPGTSLLYDQITLKIILIGKTKISLRGEEDEIIHFSHVDFQKLIRERVVTGLTVRQHIGRNTDVYKIASKIEREEDKAEALFRYEIIKPFLNGNNITGEFEVTDRTIRNWLSSFREAELRQGNGLLGLVSLEKNRGNRNERLDRRVLDLIDEFIETEIAQPIKKTKTILYGLFCNLCQEKGITSPPSYKTLFKKIKSLLTNKIIQQSEGSKVAYQQAEFLERSDLDIPIHGDRPWEYAHIDHTELDEELAHSITNKKMGKAWLTLLFDSYSRRVLAYYLTYDPPSYRSLLGVMRECVRRHGRLPECVIVDNGKDLKSIYFEKLCARFKCNILFRPPTSPRFGAIIERFIHTMNKQFVHNLRGNTQVMKNPRQVTKAVNPKNLTAWDFLMLDEHLGRYFYEQYDTREHSSLGRSPLETYEAAIVKFNLPYDSIEYDEDFIMDTLPSTRSGKATIVKQRGIKLHGIFYNSKLFRNSVLHGNKVRVHYDPYNMAIAYAYVGNQWIVCYAPPRIYLLLKDRSEREMRLIFEEERQKNRAYGRKFTERAKQLALEHAEREQSEKVRMQRDRDEELRKIAKSKNNQHSTVSSLDSPDSVEKKAADLSEIRKSKQPRVFNSARRTA
jgi:putative transposase